MVEGSQRRFGAPLKISAEGCRLGGESPVPDNRLDAAFAQARKLEAGGMENADKTRWRDADDPVVRWMSRLKNGRSRVAELACVLIALNR